MARCTGILQVDLELFLASENSFLKRNVDNSAEVCSLHRSIVCPSSASAATEQVAENIAEDITHISAAKVEAAESAGSCAATAVFKCSVAKLIVLTPFVRITQHAIGFCRLFKFCLGLFVARVHIRMVFLGQFTVCFF